MTVKEQIDKRIADYALVTKTFKAIPKPIPAEEDEYMAATRQFNADMKVLKESPKEVDTKMDVKTQKDTLTANHAVITQTFYAIKNPSQAQKDAYALATKRYHDAFNAL